MKSNTSAYLATIGFGRDPRRLGYHCFDDLDKEQRLRPQG